MGGGGGGDLSPDHLCCFMLSKLSVDMAMNVAHDGFAWSKVCTCLYQT